MAGLQKIAIVVLIILIIAGLAVLILNPVRPVLIEITPGNGQMESRFGVFGAVKTPGYYSADGPRRIEEAVELAGGLSEDADVSGAQLAKWIEDGETVIIPTQGLGQPTLTPLSENALIVDLNSAAKEELMKLPGIGEKRAADIIALREKKGGFSEKEDILEIQGISEKLLESIYDLIIVR